MPTSAAISASLSLRKGAASPVGPERIALLEAIGVHGSISSAAQVRGLEFQGRLGRGSGAEQSRRRTVGESPCGRPAGRLRGGDRRRPSGDRRLPCGGGGTRTRVCRARSPVSR